MMEYVSPKPPEEIEREELALEPVELIRQSGVVVRMGKEMLAAGTGSYRVKEAMQRVAIALGLDRLEAHVTLTEITATSFRGRIFRTEVGQVRSLGVNSDRIQQLEDFALSLRPGVTAADVGAGLDKIAARKQMYPAWANACFAALACGAFTFLNNGGKVEIAAVLVASFLGQFLRVSMLRRHLNQFIAAVLSAALATGAYVGLIELMSLMGADPARHEAGYIAAVLFLIPGFPLITAALDLVKLDFTAGVARLAYALMIMVSAAIGIWMVAWACNLTPTALPPLGLSVGVLWVCRAIASFMGVFGFAMMFNSPWRMAVCASTIGMVANLVRLALIDATVPNQLATAVGALIVGLIAAWASPRFRFPRVTLSVPGVLIMVPGAASYRALLYLVQGNISLAVTNLVTASVIFMGIAVGLAFSRMITDREWRFDH